MKLSVWFALLLTGCSGFKSSMSNGIFAENGSSQILALSSLSGWSDQALSSSNLTLAFDAIPSLSAGNGEDVVIGLSPVAAAAYTDLAATVRFYNNIDVRNGSSYTAVAAVPYSAGTSYHIEIDVNLASHIYSVFVTPAGGARTQLAQNYAFRSEQANVAAVAYLAEFASGGGASVTNVTVSFTLPNPTPSPIPVLSPPAPSPTPTPTPTPSPTPVLAQNQSVLTHGKDLTLAMVGPAAIGITSFTNGGSGGSIYNASSASYVQQINTSATYDGFAVSGPHLLIQGVTISGSLAIYATVPVVIRGSYIHGTGNWAIYAGAGASPVYVLYSDLGGLSETQTGPEGIQTSNAGHNVFARNHITFAADGFSISSQNDQIVENYLEKFSNFGGAHNDGLQAPGNNDGMVIARNKILNQIAETSCINLGTWGGGTARYVTIDSNYFAGGGYSVYGGVGGASISNHIVVTNNVFGFDFYSTIGYYGAVAYWEYGTGSVWSGNADTNGKAITP